MSKNKTATILLTVIGLPFALIGLLSASSVVWQCYQDLRMQYWQPTECRIVSTKLVQESGEDVAVFRVEADYRYEWLGKEHIGKRVYWNSSSDSFKSRHQRLFDELEQHRIDQKTYRCWVNPNFPSEAVLFRGGLWAQITFTSLMAIFCGSVGLGLLGILVYSWTENRKQLTSELNADINLNRPWMSRGDWARDEVVYSKRRNGLIWQWIAIFVLLLTAPGTIICIRELVDGNRFALLGFIPMCIGLFIFISSRRALNYWRRFGDSTLRLITCPGVIGGEFRALIRPDRLLPSKDGYELRLTCNEIESHTDGEGTTRNVTNVFDEQRMVSKELRDEANTLWIPVLFGIPYSAPETKLEKDGYSTTWELEVQSLTIGHDYKAKFEVPIFTTSESDEHFELSEDSSSKFVAPADSFAEIRKSGILVDTSDGEQCQFTFPARRHFGFAFAMMVVQAAFVCGIAALLNYFWRPGMIPVTLILSFFFVWSVLDVLFYRSQVSTERKKLTVRSGWIILGRPRVIEASEIKQWLLVPAGSWGSVNSYNLGIQLNSNSTLILAKRVLPTQLAEQLKLRMKQRVQPANQD